VSTISELAVISFAGVIASEAIPNLFAVSLLAMRLEA